MKDPDIPRESPLLPDEIACSLPDQFWGSQSYATDTSSQGALARREQEELRLIAGSRKERKEIMNAERRT